MKSVDKYQPTIGLEIHAELNTASKMFCGCANPVTQPGGGLELKPNSLVCPVCLGLPGALPFANEQAIVKTYLIAQAVGCKLAENTHWERKNYFYPDLPKGFQISQYACPIGEHGKLAHVAVRRVHLEEDTGKLIHPANTDYSLVDYNRSGVPLVELVTEPEITSSKQAADFAREYQMVLRYLGVSSADMEKGQLRVEANISINMGTKVEIKNLNSFKTVERAIEYEIKRQKQILEKGDTVIQETRGWHEAKQETFPQRVKETESDYRYFPEPDLPPISDKYKKQAERIQLPELPGGKRAKLVSLGVPNHYASVLVANPQLLKRFEQLTDHRPKQLQNLARIMVNRPEIRVKSDKEILALAELPDHKLKLALEGKTLEEKEVTTKELILVMSRIITKHPKAVADFRLGKQEALGFLLGQVKRELPHIDPQLVLTELHKVLKKK
ncbi:MAG: Asp-tRNA(Asn)/Glu-tRNA(Gln) amidotransferase subunit GatB [Patescibacteria group bacterium]